MRLNFLSAQIMDASDGDGIRRWLSHALLRPAVWLLACVAQSGCTFDNGLPSDLLALLAARGIHPEVQARSAPLSSRGGYLAIARDTELEARIIVTLGLVPMRELPPDVQQAIASMSVQAAAAHGVVGRHASLKLANRAQLEYLVLLTTRDLGKSYLFAAYAYG